MRIETQPISGFLSALAAKSPTPGGGAAAAAAAAVGAALAEMVVQYSVGKKSLAEHQALHQRALAQLSELRDKSLELADADAKAYGALNELWKLDASDPRRQSGFQPALEAAIAVPTALLDQATRAMALLTELAGRTNSMLASDLAIAAVLMEAAARGAAWNIKVNLPQLEDRSRRSAAEAHAAQGVRVAQEAAARIEEACRM